MIETIRAVYRALRLRAGGDAGDRIHRRARQVPARPGPAERGRVLVPGRRRAVAVAALRPDRAARALRGGEFPERCALPYRSYRFGWVFRNEKPGPGRFRQFMQFDADTVGAATHGRRRRDLHDGGGHDGGAGHPARQLCGEGEQPQGARWRDGMPSDLAASKCGKRLTVLRAIDKLDRLGSEGVRLLLGPGRKDESGDFTKGAGLNERADRRGS